MTTPATSVPPTAAEIFLLPCTRDWYSVKSSVPKFSEYSAQEKIYSLAEVREMRSCKNRFKTDANRKENYIN